MADELGVGKCDHAPAVAEAHQLLQVLPAPGVRTVGLEIRAPVIGPHGDGYEVETVLGHDLDDLFGGVQTLGGVEGFPPAHGERHQPHREVRPVGDGNGGNGETLLIVECERLFQQREEAPRRPEHPLLTGSPQLDDPVADRQSVKLGVSVSLHALQLHTGGSAVGNFPAAKLELLLQPGGRLGKGVLALDPPLAAENHRLLSHLHLLGRRSQYRLRDRRRRRYAGALEQDQCDAKPMSHFVYSFYRLCTPFTDPVISRGCAP